MRFSRSSMRLACALFCIGAAASSPSDAQAQSSPTIPLESAPLETTAFPNRDAFIRSFVEQAEPQCFNAGIPFSFPGGSAFVPAESPYDDIVCDERGTLRTIFSSGRSGRVEVVTIPNVDPLINHLRFLGGLALLGDCPESAPRWPGCFPLPELGERAPVNLPPGAFFQPLPAAQDRMTVDRFLNMCRLHELVMPEPIAGNPQSLVDARFQFIQFFGLQTTAGPSESLLRQQFSGTPPACSGGIPPALVLRELLDLGLSEDGAIAVAEEASERGARTEEVIEDLVRACDGLGNAARCFPETVAGVPFGPGGSCSTPMQSIGACTAGDPSCGERRVCLPGSILMTAGRCDLDPTLPECSILGQLTRAGVDPELADVLTTTSPENGANLLDLVQQITEPVAQQLFEGLTREFTVGCDGAEAGDRCVGLSIPGVCSPGSESSRMWCLPTDILIRRASAQLLDDAKEVQPPVCPAGGVDVSGDGSCDLCEQLIGLNGEAGASDLLSSTAALFIASPLLALLSEIQIDERMIKELDKSAQIALGTPQPVDPFGVRQARNERRVLLYEDGTATESDCGGTATCPFSFPKDNAIVTRAQVPGRVNLVTSDTIAYGHIHPLRPEEGDVARARKENKLNRLPSAGDRTTFKTDPASPRRPFYTRGTDGRITKLEQTTRVCLGVFSFESRDPDSSILP